MATTKKKPVTKATTARKPAAKTAHKSAPKKHAVVEQSFRPTKETTPFMTFNFTMQSVYWLILSGLVLALGAWVMHLNVQIQEIYDQVELNTQLSESYLTPTVEKAAPAVEATQPSAQ